MRFYSSDWHLDHKNILRFCPNRPASDVAEMNRLIIAGVNKHVAPDDELWLLGDVAFCSADALRGYFDQISCKNIHLVLGNHDKLIRSNMAIQRDLFKSIQEYKVIKTGQDHIILSHFAFRVWDKAHYGAYHLYGHSHGSLPGVGRSMDVGVDTRPDMSPWSEGEIIRKLQSEKMVEHHGD